jgi:hypothetical protein
LRRYIEVRCLALQSLFREFIKYSWPLMVPVWPIHWFRTRHTCAIPDHRVIEAIAVNVLAVACMCLDVKLKLGIMVGRCRLTLSKPVLKAPAVPALEATK